MVRKQEGISNLKFEQFVVDEATSLAETRRPNGTRGLAHYIKPDFEIPSRQLPINFLLLV